MRKSTLFILCILALSLAFGTLSCIKDKNDNDTQTENITGNDGNSGSNNDGQNNQNGGNDKDEHDNNDDSTPEILLPLTFKFSENFNSVDSTIEIGEDLELKIDNLTAGAVVTVYVDDEIAVLKDGAYSLLTATAGDHKTKVVVDNKVAKIIRYKVLLPALEIMTCALSSDDTNIVIDSYLALNIAVNNSCAITAKVNGNAIKANKDGVFVLPTDKAGEFYVSVEFNDGQNAVQNRELYYKVWEKELLFVVNNVEFKMMLVYGCEGGFFYMAETETSQALWTAVMGKDNNPSKDFGGGKCIGDNYPVNNVSYYSLNNGDNCFLVKLNAALSNKYDFRLPSCVEWLFVASGGVYPTDLNHIVIDWRICPCEGDGPIPPDDVRNTISYGSDYSLPSAFGVRGMTLNVYELCYDMDSSLRLVINGQTLGYVCAYSYGSDIRFRLALTLR